MRHAAVVMLIAGLGCAGGPVAAPAQEAAAPPPAAASPPAADDQRFTFHRMRDVFVRLDARTGQVAHCGWSETGWTCQTVPEERAALEAEIARLQAENAALKQALLSRGIDLPGAVRADPPAAQAPDQGADGKGRAEAEIDRAIGFMKGVWRRLIEMMADVQRDIQRKS